MHPLAARRYGLSFSSFSSRSPFHLPGWLFSGLSVSALQRMTPAITTVLSIVFPPHVLFHSSATYPVFLHVRRPAFLVDSACTSFVPERPGSLGRFGLEPDHTHVDFCPASYICAFLFWLGLDYIRVTCQRFLVVSISFKSSFVLLRP